MYANVYWCKGPLWCVSFCEPWSQLACNLDVFGTVLQSIFIYIHINSTRSSTGLFSEHCLNVLDCWGFKCWIQIWKNKKHSTQTKLRPKSMAFQPKSNSYVFFVFGFMVTQQNPNCIQVDAPLLHSFFFNTYVKDRVHVLRCLHSFDLLFGSSKLLHFFVLPQFVFQICSPFSPVETTIKICLKVCGRKCDTGQSESVEKNKRHGKGNHLSLACCLTIPPNKKI